MDLAIGDTRRPDEIDVEEIEAEWRRHVPSCAQLLGEYLPLLRRRHVESFWVESWLDHLRQHDRVTGADRLLQSEIRALLVPGSKPDVAHYIAPPAPNTRTIPSTNRKEKLGDSEQTGTADPG